jgi:lipopolysaccharide/colanic/teichoic acid biosynthesis glycosyltransferase
MIKRLFDIVFATFALLVTWPLILIGAAAVKLTSPGPAFYRAKRAGFRGKPFHMYKLRTMRAGMDTSDRKITEENDGRVTPFGRFLRKFEIDELPQFWNVLRGEMSVVGPRPEDWGIVDKCYTPQQRRTLEVRPGVVSPFDVHWYPDITYHDPRPPGVTLQEYYLKRHMVIQLAEAMDYIEHQSLLLDLKVIMQTAYCILVRSWLVPPKKQPLLLEPEAHD